MHAMPKALVELAPGAPAWPQFLVTLWGWFQLVDHFWDSDQLLEFYSELESTRHVSLCLRPSLMLFRLVGHMSGW